MKRVTNGSGYFFNDDRASGGKFDEDDLIGCGHCPKSEKLHSWKLQGGMCFICGKPLCFACYAEAHKTKQCKGSHEEQVIRVVNESYHAQQNAKILGI